MILITGASGKTGRAVVGALVRAGGTVRALVRHPSQSDSLRSLGANEVVEGDLRQMGTLHSAFENIRAVYHICPNVHPDEVGIGRGVIAAAGAAGVKRLVLHSVLHPQTEAMPHHWNKLRVEESLIESGLGFTILQPTAYMQNLLDGWEMITREGVLRLPYPTETRLSLVDLKDVAEAAARVLTESGHEGTTYELAGTPPLSQDEVAAILTETLGRRVRAQAESLEAWELRAKQVGLGDQQRATLVEMFQHYGQHGLIGNPNVLRWLLNRKPTSLGEFVLRVASG
jgi:uncharacterized protein YbjT (DUF2867 family)